MSRFSYGAPLLLGDNMVPGLRLPEDLAKYGTQILEVCRQNGLDFFPTIVQLLTYDEISEVAAYSGFPVRYPHYRFGMEYEQIQRRYEYGFGKIYEMIVNTNPSIIYCLNSNSLVQQLTVIAHATAHNDFFKNNIHFADTDRGMHNRMANHGTRIRRYMTRWGKDRVTEFIDHVLTIDSLIDPASARKARKRKSVQIRDSRTHRQPRRIDVPSDRLYMDPFLNTQEFRRQEKARIETREIEEDLGIFEEPTRDVLGYLRDHAPLKPWQADVASMLYEEALYFAPQRTTQIANEGWASFWDHEIMARQGYSSLGQARPDMGIVEYAEMKMRVLGGKYSLNPYKLGFDLFLSIEERWNKGQFGPEWDNCRSSQKADWDQNLGLGREKIFEVRKYYDDVNMIDEFFTEDFCREREYFEWKSYPNGEYRIESRDHATIKRNLIRQRLNGGLPDVRLVEPNYRGKGYFLLEHQWEGKTLDESNLRSVLTSIWYLWRNDVFLSTRGKGGQRLVYRCNGLDSQSDVSMTSEERHVSEWSSERG